MRHAKKQVLSTPLILGIIVLAVAIGLALLSLRHPRGPMTTIIEPHASLVATPQAGFAKARQKTSSSKAICQKGEQCLKGATKWGCTKPKTNDCMPAQGTSCGPDSICIGCPKGSTLCSRK